MSKLLERAKVRFENAKNDLKKVEENDAYLDDCCFNLQQALEFSLKYIVELNGENYVQNHDIRAQLNKLSNIGVHIPMEEKIRLMSSTINSWETESRYLDSFTALLADIEEVRDIVDETIQYCEGLVIEVDILEEEDIDL